MYRLKPQCLSKMKSVQNLKPGKSRWFFEVSAIVPALDRIRGTVLISSNPMGDRWRSCPSAQLPSFQLLPQVSLADGPNQFSCSSSADHFKTGDEISWNEKTGAP
ncbi:hypothetical protein I7I51_00294 [Histoplasma capsulatum]|uniref:Uncharacterized protein n=1 Tax=Ajellomyces capsulatus TaxID=5037 RepID=A0A8A1MGH2_AJECA|nr:hypothetical protein I7I51_00294 [Histoplasma capsulatum]